MKGFIFFAVVSLLSLDCSKGSGTAPIDTPTPKSLIVKSITIDKRVFENNIHDVCTSPVILITFSEPVKESTVNASVSITNNVGAIVNTTATLQNKDSVMRVVPASPLSFLSKYNFTITTFLQSASGGKLNTAVNKTFFTSIDSSDKFSRVSDSALLTLIQKQTFKYFWEFGHPVSGMARERNTSGDIVTTGGTGFGIMSMLAAVNRNFITRNDALTRIKMIVDFLQNKCTNYHGAYAHWINGSTGQTQPFSAQDDGADIVETAYLLQGLLCAREFFNNNSPAETDIRNNINNVWDAMDWNWFRKDNENVLYWHWSPNFGWAMNMPVKGWNEALIVYVLAASSKTHAIPKVVYDNGWAQNGAMVNGNSYYGVTLPLGPPMGGPLFFAHYSFLGIDPTGLSDAYANYFNQNQAHTQINYNYCIDNPHRFFGYSKSCWGLTASDDNKVGYTAHEPNNDDGVISPTAAISSMPYTPVESMAALKFFYYTLGDKIWKDYGFIDAFSLNDLWFPNSFLAIDQGPEIVMIENYRSELLWNLFMGCPEIKQGMKNLGFSGPKL